MSIFWFAAIMPRSISPESLVGFRQTAVEAHSGPHTSVPLSKGSAVFRFRSSLKMLRACMTMCQKKLFTTCGRPHGLGGNFRPVYQRQGRQPFNVNG